MSLISGKEALIALANGQEVLWRTKSDAEVKDMKKDTPNLELALSSDCNYRFWIKPKTITINGIEVPAPFEPKSEGEEYFFLYPSNKGGYGMNYFNVDDDDDETWIQFGAWKTEDEIKQVVEALRSVFK